MPTNLADPEKLLRDDFENFCRQLSEEGVFPSALDAEAAFTSICNLMLHWLVRLKRPVDLGFIKLHPSPYRSNWKSLILQNDVWRNRRGRYGTALHYAYLKRLLRDTRFAAFDIHNGRAAWSVEVELKEDWLECSRSYEFTHKGHRYANYWWKLQNWLIKNSRKFYRIYTAHILDATRPYVSLRREPAARIPSQSSYRSKLAGYPVPGKELSPVPAWLAHAKGKTEIPCVEIRLVGETKEGLLPLSDLRPFEINVRHHWKPASIHRARRKQRHSLNKKLRKRGLLVLDARKGKSKTGELLAV